MPTETWYFGLTRDGGYYHIVAVSQSQAKVIKEMQSFSGPTALATRDELEAVGISERQVSKWLDTQGCD